MKRMFAAVVISMMVALTGCGGGDNPPPTFVADIVSNPGLDGDIEQTSPGAFIVTQGMSPTVQSVFAGIDTGTGTEFRAFLDFPLGGSGGVPGNAVIASAVLDLFINSIQSFTGTVPIRIELVSFQPPALQGTDFDRVLLPPLAVTTIVPPLSQVDVGTHVPVDVTPLMVEAQRLGLSNFQVRIMEDLGPVVPGLIEIDDTTAADRGAFAPLLEVTYF